MLWAARATVGSSSPVCPHCHPVAQSAVVTTRSSTASNPPWQCLALGNCPAGEEVGKGIAEGRRCTPGPLCRDPGSQPLHTGAVGMLVIPYIPAKCYWARVQQVTDDCHGAALPGRRPLTTVRSLVSLDWGQCCQRLQSRRIWC